jgi:hypothetical protein
LINSCPLPWGEGGESGEPGEGFLPTKPRNCGILDKRHYRDIAEWERESMLQWASEARPLASTFTHQGLSEASSEAVAGHACQADAVLEAHQERAGVRLACLHVELLK